MYDKSVEVKGFIKYFLIGASFLCLFSCSPKPVEVNRPAFCSDSAYTFIAKQMAFGPRVPNSAAHMQCAVWLIEQLRAYGAEVELQKGFMPDYRGNNQQIYNIIGHFSPYSSEDEREIFSNRPRILLCAHYDTRPWCDEEEIYTDRYYNVPGANDGASGIGILLEVARQLSIRMDTVLSPLEENAPPAPPIDIIFFDCEDMGTPSFYTGPEREDTWCLGSQLWATNYAKKNSTITYQFGLLLDMVGAPDAVFPLELYSTNYAANYQQQLWHSAERLGHGVYFSHQQSYPITDDHYYINRIAGIPCVDIIHYDAKNATGFPTWWHTRQDNMDNISKSTLQAVGEVVMSQL